MCKVPCIGTENQQPSITVAFKYYALHSAPQNKDRNCGSTGSEKQTRIILNISTNAYNQKKTIFYWYWCTQPCYLGASQ